MSQNDEFVDLLFDAWHFNVKQSVGHFTLQSICKTMNNRTFFLPQTIARWRITQNKHEMHPTDFRSHQNSLNNANGVTFTKYGHIVVLGSK